MAGPRKDKGIAHMYRKGTEVAVSSIKVSGSFLPTYWDARMDTPVPNPRKMHRRISTGWALVPTAARDEEPQKLPITRVSTVL